MYRSSHKELVKQSYAPKKIAEIQFGTLPTADIQKVSEVRVHDRSIFSPPNELNPSRHPTVNGVMDSRMGVSGKSNPDRCSTCARQIANCAGHFGYIQLELPVFHAGFFKHTLTILQCICKRCSRVMMSTNEKAEQLRKLRAGENKGSLWRAQLFKQVVEMCKPTARCPYCGYANGVVKKVPGAFFKIVHERWRSKNLPHAFKSEFTQSIASIADSQKHKDLGKHIKDSTLINPMRAYELLVRIPEEDYELLWMNADYGAPDTLILWVVPVPPVPIRPSVPQEQGGGSTEDDITITLQQIVEMNGVLHHALARGATFKMVSEDWEYLQIQVALFINGETPGIPRALIGNKFNRGLCQRLKGKQGRFRGNLSGKRVDFSSRTVISPDPNLGIEQVGIPIYVAKTLTYPEKVNEYNIGRLKKAILNGQDQHPGANIVRHANRSTVSLAFANREDTAAKLRVGDIVERHMDDGDIVLFNRQPSLHKMSIMAHRVKVQPWRTFRFNECVCTPYNADFDGDEMNLHLPQTEESRAEAAQLMSIQSNLITPRNGEPLVAATQDFITAAYLVTHKDVFFDREEFCKWIACFADANEQVDLVPPAIVKPKALWTGKQLMTMLVRPRNNTSNGCYVNLESKEKFYKKDDHFCPSEGFVLFRGGEHLCGALGKKTLGAESKTGLFYVLIRDFGAAEATRCMARLAKFCARYIGDRGFSIGIDDVTPSDEMIAQKKEQLKLGKEKATAEIELYNTKQIRLKPGCNALQSFESNVNGILGKVRENCGKAALSALHPRNAALTMAQCGSKGSPLNISQMVACLGQQSVAGARIQEGFVNRTLPHFPSGALYPAAKGFVENSFYSGLTPTEFFFHTMGGREGLVDTAVKTAETGYMARRLMKALEDLSLQYDNTVRNSEKTVVQFKYGDDSLNPQDMEERGRPVDFSRLFWNLSINRKCYMRNEKDIDMANACVIRGEQGSDSMVDKKHANGTNIKRNTNSSKMDIQDVFDEMRSAPNAALGEIVQPHAEDSVSMCSLDIEDQLEMTFRKPEWTAIGDLYDQVDFNQRIMTDNENFLREIQDKFMEVSNRIKGYEINAGIYDALQSTKESMDNDKTLINSCVSFESIESIRSRLLAMKTDQFNKWSVKAKRRGTAEYCDALRLLCDTTCRMTFRQFRMILAAAYHRYNMALIQPGEAVGAVGAQSLSEPGTQMTLKTFHFAGVASMNVTLGVPRLKEIINASKSISTPIIEARLVQEDNVHSARIVKARIEKTLLREVVEYIKEVHDKDGGYILIKLCQETIDENTLNITTESVKNAILACNIDGSDLRSSTSILRALKADNVDIIGRNGDKIRVRTPKVKEDKKRKKKTDTKDNVGESTEEPSTTIEANQKEDKSKKDHIPETRKPYFYMQALKSSIQHVIVQGYSAVSRAVINEESNESDAQTKNYYLLVEGYGLREVMGCAGVDGRRTKSNHIIDMQEVLGIEAARYMITSEIRFIMTSYGITVDNRHLLLLSDVMTFKGEVLGITRFGVAKMRESVLMLASFEKTTDHLFDAAVHARQDAIVGVSECIIMGVPIPIGTGLFKLLHKAKQAVEVKKRPPLLSKYSM